MEELTVEEIIKYIIRIEQESCIFYRKASRALEGSMLKKFFDLLAEQEIEHIKQLHKLIGGSIIEEEELIKTYNIDTSNFDVMILSSDIPISATAEGIMKLAVKREENTKYTYRMLSSISDLDIRIKKVFKNIEKLEENQITELEKKIKKPEEWA